MNRVLSTTTLALVAAPGLAVPAAAQVAGSTAVGTNVTAGTRVALGWSVKRPIVGAGILIDTGRHDVAFAVDQARERGGRIVMPLANRDPVQTMPRLGHSDDGSDRARFVASSDKKIAQDKVARLQERDVEAGGDLEAAEGKLAKFMRAGRERWTAFQADLRAVAARLRKAIDT